MRSEYCVEIHPEPTKAETSLNVALWDRNVFFTLLSSPKSEDHLQEGERLSLVVELTLHSIYTSGTTPFLPPTPTKYKHSLENSKHSSIHDAVLGGSQQVAITGGADSDCRLVWRGS